MAATISKAVASLAAAKEALQTALSDARASCEHRIVSEMPYRAGNYFGSRAAHRICNHCRLIEEGSHWSGGSTWSKHDHSASDLGNVKGRIVVPIDNDTFWKMRVAP
ncbi:hypothetical protein QWJ46_00510 [Rhizobium sp. CBN3]|uniref:hypothetical protein n=1 Tax=Rhizobium sp. CBN3 TaxID=3058045 RepID=UPI002670EFA9|nr:hypothetical protein [Rhizobium sp. CBN3]MDO3431155.1 hypothetical protein [Rhizobium sp. CBN3]